jgi:hypothetical protein
MYLHSHQEPASYPAADFKDSFTTDIFATWAPTIDGLKSVSPRRYLILQSNIAYLGVIKLLTLRRTAVSILPDVRCVRPSSWRTIIATR